MTRPYDYHGQTALVTGASSGIGEGFAYELAARGAKLVLAARRLDKLDALAAILRANGASVQTIAIDLSEPGAVPVLCAELAERELQVDILVNNAGAGSFDRFESIPPAILSAQTQLNVVSVVELTRAFLPAMARRRFGVVINLSSSLASFPLPYAATYAASKAFVRSFTEALWAEYQQTGVRVLALCPGPTRNGDPTRDFGPMREPSDVVATALRAVDEGRPSALDGPVARKQAFVGWLLPRRLMLRLGGKQNAPKSAPVWSADP